MADEQLPNTENENTSTQTDGGEEQTVSMTQSKLDGLINGKFASGAEKATKELLAGIGVDDVDVLKSIVTAHRDNEEASKSELQKMQELLDVANTLNVDLESRLATQATDAEIQNLAMQHGINPEKMKYFKMDYLDASGVEGFDVEKFIGVLKEKQPDFFGFIQEGTRRNLPNPQSRKTPSTQIKMNDYVQLPAAERAKYKATDITR